jgi:membrane protein required for colicin V production
MSTLTALDWVILAVIGFSSLMSIFRGFVKEASSILSWVAAFTIASKFYSQVSIYLTFSNDDLTRKVIASILLFIGSLIALGFVSSTISSLVKKAGLSSFDRLLGVAFGVVRGVLIVSAVLALSQMLNKLHILTFIQDYPWYKDSLFVPELQEIVNWFFKYMGTPETGA